MNTGSKQTHHTSEDLFSSLQKVRSYVRQIDLNGYEILRNDIDGLSNDYDAKDLMAQVVRSYFEQRCENEPNLADIEDKRGAIDRLDRTCHFDNEAFALTLSEVMAYALQDIHPEA